MYPSSVNPSRDDILALIRLAIEEDCPVGDVTTDAIVAPQDRSLFTILVKSSCVACGIGIAVTFFKGLDPAFKVIHQVTDGDPLEKGDIFLRGEGLTRSILTGERSVLNILQRLCGIAYQTRQYTEMVEASGVKILDTRKTTPGLRLFEKYAVRVGGGTNHRFGLSDMVLLKENHLAIAARNADDYMDWAIQRSRENNPDLSVEVEVENPTQALLAAEAGADVILLDNMMPDAILESIQAVDKRAVIEVSGGITLKNICDYALPGVNFISVGALTHSVQSADLSLLLEDA